jgi:acyl carrier protein
LEPQPDGIPGELYLAGFCLADGYLNRKDLTHERFVVDPFSSEPRARMYKTGDLARFLPDGSLEFLGRADQQVKIRGFRVEPGEIEAALAEHPEVREAVVKAIEDPTGGRRLAAYLTTRRAVRSAALREYLRERLPDYMIPACFVILPEFPLTHGGKVNRRALPPPDPENAAEKPLGIKTELSPASEILKGLWQELLQVRAVGPEDDFFALGGHSLLAVQLVSRICDAFGVQLPVRAVFEAPTLRAMAEKVEGAGQIDAEVLEPLRPLSRPESLPLSFAQERLWTACRLDESGIAYNMPAALRLQGPLNVAALAEAFRAVSKRHEILRTGFIERLGQPTAVIENDVVVELRVDDPALPSGKERADYWRDATSAEAGRAFDLTRPPLMRARLVGTSKNDHLLLLTMHHLISDGWSIGVLARELSAFYQAFIEGRSPALSPLSVQYADYALWQKKWLSPKVLQRQLNRWTDEFSAADFSTGRLGDRPHSSGQACRGAAMPVRFNADLARQLNLVARANGATLYMVLLAAWAVLTTKISGRAEGFFGVPAAGRTRRELEALIGFFVNLLPVRLKPDGARPFSEFLAQVRRKTLEAYGRQEVPFEEIVKRMRASGLSATTPPVQSVVVLQNTPARAMRLEGVEITSVEIGIPSAKFELLLSLDESPSGLSGYLEYNADLFLPKTCSTLASGFQDICLAIAANPGCTPDSLMEGLFRSDALAVEENGDEQFSFPE